MGKTSLQIKPEKYSDAPGQAEFAVEFFDKKQPAIATDITIVEIEFNFSAFRTLKERIRCTAFCHKQTSGL